MGELASLTLTSLLISLRIGPTLAFAPPFTLIRIPVIIRVLLAMALSVCLASSAHINLPSPVESGWLAVIAARELLIGMLLALSLQIAFAAISFAGRVLDIQAGFGLALLADPTTQNNMPLVGSLLAYAAGMIFFTTGGPNDLLFVWRDSLAIAPLGHAESVGDIHNILRFLSLVFTMTVGLVAVVLLGLFIIDLTIAFMSKTLPQMNMLLLGFQVKSIAVLVLLPFVFSISGSLFLRIIRLMLQAGRQIL